MVVEQEVWLIAGETIRPDATRLVRPRPPDFKNPLAEADGMPGVAWQWMEVEGPFFDSVASGRASSVVWRSFHRRRRSRQECGPGIRNESRAQCHRIAIVQGTSRGQGEFDGSARAMPNSSAQIHERSNSPSAGGRRRAVVPGCRPMRVGKRLRFHGCDALRLHRRAQFSRFHLFRRGARSAVRSGTGRPALLFSLEYAA